MRGVLALDVEIHLSTIFGKENTTPFVGSTVFKIRGPCRVRGRGGLKRLLRLRGSAG